MKVLLEIGLQYVYHALHWTPDTGDVSACMRATRCDLLHGSGSHDEGGNDLHGGRLGYLSVGGRARSESARPPRKL